jgi:hypothetical protein
MFNAKALPQVGRSRPFDTMPRHRSNKRSLIDKRPPHCARHSVFPNRMIGIPEDPQNSLPARHFNCNATAAF